MTKIFLYVIVLTSRFFQLVQDGLVQYQQFTLKPRLYTEITTQRGTMKSPQSFQIIFFNTDQLETARALALQNITRLSIIYDTSSAAVSYPIPKNLKFVYAEQNQSSAVAGYFCFLLQQKYPQTYKTQTGVVFGSFDILTLEDFFVGFTFGYAYEDPFKADDVIRCPQATTFRDNQVSFDVTQQFLQDNPDIGVVFALNGSAYLGSYNALEQKGKFAIGVDDDYFNYIYSFNPSLAYIVIGSVLKYMNQLMFKYLSSCPSTDTPTNTAYSLQDGVVDFVISSFLTNETDIRLKTNIFKSKIASGEIIVPSVLNPQGG